MKKMKPKSHIDELCYPFIYEDSLLCDFEIVTDKLTRLIGYIIDEISVAPMSSSSDELQLNSLLIKELEQLQPLVYHLNGSIRGRLAIQDQDHQWLLERYRAHKQIVSDRIDGFVLPRGSKPVGLLNQASSMSKEVIRWMVRIHKEEQKEIPEILPKFANLLCNYFFVLTLRYNQVRDYKERPFQSKSY